jgi:hypothetical protein
MAQLRVSVVIAVGVVVWLAVVGLGLHRIWAYSTEPGAEASAPGHWPADSTIDRSAVRPTLVMFLHPLCTCSRASLAELDAIMRAAGDRLETVVVVHRPDDVDDEWDRSGIWNAVRRLRGVAIRTDRDGAEAQRFGAATSGQVLVYGPEGELRFAGGITGSRGHEGDNPGRQRVLAVVEKTASVSPAHSVYGCSLGTVEGTGR